MDNDELDLLTRALGACRDGDPVMGQALLGLVLVDNPANAIANHQMGVLAIDRGEMDTAATFFRQAVLSNPDEPEFHNNLGVVLQAVGDLDGAAQAFRAATTLRPDFAQAQNNLGAALEAKGEMWDAVQAYRRATDIDPGYIDARENLNLACAKAAAPWHFPMMADTERNEAYDAALRRAAPGRRVLDIGSGSGLLAMMAARAGAAEVTTCEAVASIARAAKDIIAANGLSDRIHAHAKRSDELQVGTDMAAPAQVLVSEIFASGVLSEAVLPTLEHARRHLLTPDAQIIPCAAPAARGYLVGGEAVEGQVFAPSSTGFNLSGFDVFAPNKVGLHLDRLPHEAFSDDFEIAYFDLTQLSFAEERQVLSVRATRSGRCVGVAQWLWLRLDAQTTYENRPRPSAGANGWMHVVYRFPTALNLEAGEEVRLLASHSRTALTVALTKNGAGAALVAST